MTDPRVQELLDIEAIKVVKAQYFRFVDTKQWDALRGLFTADAVFDFVALGRFDDPDAAIDAIRALLEKTVTVHHGHMPEVTITTPDTAHGIFAMFDYLIPSEDEPHPPGFAGMRGLRQGFGHYHDDFRRVPEGWRISTVKLTRLKQEPLPLETP